MDWHLLIGVSGYLVGFYFWGKAAYYKRRFEDPWSAAWTDFAKRQGIKSPRVLP